MSHIMDTFDYDKEFSEWVYIREQTETALISSSPATSTYSLPPSPSHVPGTTKDLSTSSNVNGDIIFSLPEHIILTVFRYGCTDPYSLYRTASLVCKQFSYLARKIPLQLVFKSTMTQRLPNCKIIALTVTTPISAEVIKLICTRYAHCLRILKLTHLNTTRETQLNEDSLAPMRNLTKLRQLSLAWRAAPNMGPMAFSFLSYLKKLRKLSLEIYEKSGNSSRYSAVLPVLNRAPIMTTYAIPPQDLHEHTNDCWHCPYAVLHPLARLHNSKSSSGNQTHVSPTSSGYFSPQPSYRHSGHGFDGPFESMMSPITSPSGSPPTTPGNLKSSRGSDGVSSSSGPNKHDGETGPIRAISAGLPTAGSTWDTQGDRRSPLFQSAPGGHVKPLQTISAAGTQNPAPISILKILADLPHLEELKLSNWRDFGPLFLLAPLTKITALTIKGRPSDLMTDGASVADAARHFLFLATLSALRNLTLAWLPPCLPQLTRLTTLDLSQAPILDDNLVADFSRGLTNLTSLSLDGLASGGQLTNTSVAHLYNLPLLRILDLSNHPHITHTAFLPSTAVAILSNSANDTFGSPQRSNSSGHSSSDSLQNLSQSSGPFATSSDHITSKSVTAQASRAPWLLIDLRLNNTKVGSLAPFGRFAPSLQHLHVQGCEPLTEADVATHLPMLGGLLSFRFMNTSFALQGGLSERMLIAYSACPSIVCFCDRVISNTRNLSLLPAAGISLQFLELFNDPSSTYPGSSSSSSSSSSHAASSSASSLHPQSKIPTEHFSPLAQLTTLKSLRLTGELLNSSLIRILAQLPSLTSLAATRVEENSSSAPKAIVKLVGLNYLTLQLTSSSAAAIWMKYAVTLPNLLHFDDGLTLTNSNVPWATHRRLYLEWHPRAVKPNRANNCTIS